MTEPSSHVEEKENQSGSQTIQYQEAPHPCTAFLLSMRSPPVNDYPAKMRLARGNREKNEAWHIVEFLKFIAAFVWFATKHGALQSLEKKERKREREAVAGWGWGGERKKGKEGKEKNCKSKSISSPIILPDNKKIKRKEMIPIGN